MFRSDYWVTPNVVAIIVTNGCRLHLEHHAKVVAARKLMEHNQQEGM